MRKLTAMAAMLAMMLVFAAPAMAHTTAVGGDFQLQFQSSGQFVGVSATQTNFGSVGAVSGSLGSASAASISQTFSVHASAEQNSLQAGDGIFLVLF